jgi:hypothetical protein
MDAVMAHRLTHRLTSTTLLCLFEKPTLNVLSFGKHTNGIKCDSTIRRNVFLVRLIVMRYDAVMLNRLFSLRPGSSIRALLVRLF